MILVRVVRKHLVAFFGLVKNEDEGYRLVAEWLQGHGKLTLPAGYMIEFLPTGLTF